MAFLKTTSLYFKNLNESTKSLYCIVKIPLVPEVIKMVSKLIELFTTELSKKLPDA